MARSPRPHPLITILASIGLATALTGCGTYTATDEPVGEGPASAEALLLDASTMPTPDDQTVWTEESTQEQGLAADGSEPVGSCQLTPLHDIGATEAVRRTFVGDDGASATQVVATLADAKSVRQTHEVLRSWHGKCAETIQAEVEGVGTLEAVEVPLGEAEAYVLFHGDQGAAQRTWESVAINVIGNYISLVVIESQAAEYDQDENPAVLAAKAVATP